MSTDRIRAALAAEADGPAVPEGREPASVATQPSDEELLELSQFHCVSITLNNGSAVSPFAEGTDIRSEVLSFARAAISRYGHQPAPPADVAPGPSMEDVGPLIAWLTEQAHYAADASQPARTTDARMLTWAAQVIGERVDEDAPAPPVEGEVGELVAWLRDRAESTSLAHNALRITRAADLLSQRHPTPVPVSEHPWKRDRWCDDEDRCWCFNQWDLQWELEYYTTGAHWCDWMLPATALPVPQGEVQP